jgi:hypothetical protein
MSSTANGGKEKETMATFTIDNDNNITGYAPGDPELRTRPFVKTGLLIGRQR